MIIPAHAQPSPRNSLPYFTLLLTQLVSGHRFQVDHQEALVLRDGVAVFVAKGGVPVLFDHEGVSQILGESMQQSA
jgi:hypothetical protein